MRDIRRILCPIDLSDPSRHALEHAVAVARWYGAKIIALHVWNPVVVPSTGVPFAGRIPPAALVPEDVEDVRNQVTRWVEAARALDVDVVLRNGRPTKEIVVSAATLSADLIVIGTHGSGGFEHLLLGSVTEHVLRHASCPVLTVPPRSHTASKLPFKRVLCPVDFSDPSLAAVELALSLTGQGHAELTLVHVCEWPGDDEPLAVPSFNLPAYVEDRERGLRERLAALIPEAAERHRAKTRIAQGKAYRAILRIGAEEASDVIVMGVHGRNPLDLMLFGSTTNQVVRRALCPVLTVKQ
jgi:nucleotide-binding universal stress UspA family protein